MANNNQIYKMSNAGGFSTLTRYPDMAAGNVITLSASYFVVAGGGGGSGLGNYVTYQSGSGGGAGGYLSGTATLTRGTTYTITVGAGFAVAPSTTARSVGASSISSIASAYGGGNGSINIPVGNQTFGASNGGGQTNAVVGPGIGYPGGTAYFNNSSSTPGAGAGGGGGGGAGSNGSGSTGGVGGAGGIGVQSSITGTATYYAGGGGGAGYTSQGAGGAGGGGAAGLMSATNGTANTGGGGGGTNGSTVNAGIGGSGVVIISIPAAAGATTGSPTVTTSGGNYIYKFTGSGSITI